jgi:hypothetical protein
MASCLRCDRGNPSGCCINVSWPAEHLPAGMYRIYLEPELRNVNEERTRKPSFLGKYQRKLCVYGGGLGDSRHKLQQHSCYPTFQGGSLM